MIKLYNNELREFIVIVNEKVLFPARKLMK